MGRGTHVDGEPPHAFITPDSTPKKIILSSNVAVENSNLSYLLVNNADSKVDISESAQNLTNNFFKSKDLKEGPHDSIQ